MQRKHPCTMYPFVIFEDTLRRKKQEMREREKKSFLTTSQRVNFQNEISAYKMVKVNKISWCPFQMSDSLNMIWYELYLSKCYNSHLRLPDEQVRGRFH